ncbi:MAG: hypothetical protein ABEI31_07575 [Halodesulfurarchaeum sp.]
MDRDTIGTLFSLVAPVATLVGLVLVFVESSLLTAIGVVLLIAGLISLMPALRFRWWDETGT